MGYGQIQGSYILAVKFNEVSWLPKLCNSQKYTGPVHGQVQESLLNIVGSTFNFFFRKSLTCRLLKMWREYQTEVLLPNFLFLHFFLIYQPLLDRYQARQAFDLAYYSHFFSISCYYQKSMISSCRDQRRVNIKKPTQELFQLFPV